MQSNVKRMFINLNTAGNLDHPFGYFLGWESVRDFTLGRLWIISKVSDERASMDRGGTDFAHRFFRAPNYSLRRLVSFTLQGISCSDEHFGICFVCFVTFLQTKCNCHYIA